MLETISNLFHMEYLITLSIGIGTGWILSYFRRSRKYYLRTQHLVKKIEDREKWIKLLEKKIPKTV